MSVTGNSTRNLSVIARNAADGYYYAGFITRGITKEENLHHVIFFNIKSQDVQPKNVIHIGGAVPWPSLKIGDYVLVGVRCRTSNLECYMPGRVVCLPINTFYENRFYTVRLFSGRTTTKPRRYIIKIGKEKYNEIYDYISYIRYRQPKRVVSEPDIRRISLLDRRPLTKKRIIFRSVSEDLFRRRHRHHHYHHLYYHDEPVERKFNPVPNIIDSETQTDDDSTEKVTKNGFTDDNGPTPPPGKPNVMVDVVGQGGKPEPKKNKQPCVRLKRNDIVLARWSDDGWYYFGKVFSAESDDDVQVIDINGYIEKIRMENILSTDENNKEIIKNDKVVALHPKYVYSYAPATVLKIHNSRYHVQFYDDTECELDEVYKIPPQKYMQDKEYIKEQELKIAGLVIARDDISGAYRPLCPNYRSQQIFLQERNNSYIVQEVIHVLSRDRPLQEMNIYWNYVIGPLDPARTMYLPAKIVSRSPFRLHFCNGQLNDHAKSSDCFLISEDYYENASQYFNAHGSKILSYMF